jgi:hypothetical protein
MGHIQIDAAPATFRTGRAGAAKDWLEVGHSAGIAFESLTAGRAISACAYNGLTQSIFATG